MAAARGLPAKRGLSHRDTATADLRLPAGGYALIDMRHAQRHASVPTLLVMPAPSFMLATAAGQLFSNVLPWLLAILGLAIVGALVIMLVRKYLRSDSGGDVPGFSLQSLREMRDQGQISEEEFERAREAMIGRIKRDASASAGSTGGAETGGSEAAGQSGHAARDESDKHAS